MKYITLLIFAMVIISIVPAVSALDPSFTFKKNETASIRLGCFDDTDKFCSKDDICTISISRPDGTILYDNSSMVNSGTYVNFNLTGTDTNQTGIYPVTAACLGTTNAISTFAYEVNPPGIFPSQQKTDATSRGVWFFVLLGTLMFGAFLFAPVSTPTKVTFMLAAVIFFLIGINIIFVGLQDEVVNPKLENLFSSLTTISFIGYRFAFLLIIITWIFTLFNTWLNKKTNENIRRFGTG